MHLRGLERFDFDSVLFPYNFPLLGLEDYARDVAALLEQCAAERVATQTIKSIARRRWPAPRPEERRSWYQPLEDDEAVDRAVRFVLSRPQLFLNSSSDFTLLPAILAAAVSGGEAPSDAEMARDVVAYDMAPLFDGGVLSASRPPAPPGGFTLSRHRGRARRGATTKSALRATAAARDRARSPTARTRWAVADAGRSATRRARGLRAAPREGEQ